MATTKNTPDKSVAPPVTGPAVAVESFTSPSTPALDALVDAKPVEPLDEQIPGQIAGNSYYGPLLQNYLRSLPRPTDDVERDLGLDIYEKMLNDPTISASIMALKIQCLSGEVRVQGRIPRPSHWSMEADPTIAAQYQKSEDIAAFISDMLDGLQQPLPMIISDMLDALAYGHSLAEMVFDGTGSKLVLKFLRVKNRYRFAYVTDRFLHFIGIVPTENASGIVPVEWIIPRKKFWHVAPFPHQSDPRGRSLLRPAYNAWYLKQQAWGDYFKYLKQYATPSLAAILENDAPKVDTLDANGNRLVANGVPLQQTAEQSISNALVAFGNSSAIALRYIKELKVLQAQGCGEAYTTAISLYDQQMSRAIILNTRALLEAQNGSKADASAGHDVFETFASYIQRQIEATFYRDVLYPLVVMNYGEALAAAFTPVLVLSSDSSRNTEGYGNMIANLARSGYIHSSQYDGIDSAIGLPERDMDAMAAEEESADTEKQQQALQYRNLINPTDGMPADAGSGEE